MDRSEFQPQEVSERGEALESTENLALQEATFEPAACVEGMGEYQQAEAIQTSLEMVMASLTTAKVPVGEVGATPQPIPRPEDEVSATPITLPIPRPEDEISATPITLPTPIPQPGEEVSATPITLPTPIPQPGEEVSATPIPLPYPGEEVSGLPIPIPHTEDEIGAKGHIKGTEGTAEIPLPGTAGEQVGFDPVPLPREADLASSTGGDPAETGYKYFQKEPGGAAEIPLPGTVGESVEPAGEAGVIDQIVVNTRSAMEEMSESFDQQYLQLQRKMQNENRRSAVVSNIMKDKNDTAKDSINNIR